MQINSLEKKVWLWTAILWVINIKIFLLLSNWEQTWQIFKYSESYFAFYKNILNYYFIFVTTIPTLTLVLTTIFIIQLFVFWLYYFKVYFHKLSKAKTENTSWLSVFGTIFTFLGFGCVACGQTLISSILFLFVSSGSMFFVEAVGNGVIVLGVVMLSFGIYRNYKIYHNKNLCKI